MRSTSGSTIIGQPGEDEVTVNTGNAKMAQNGLPATMRALLNSEEVQPIFSSWGIGAGTI